MKVVNISLTFELYVSVREKVKNIQISLFAIRRGNSLRESFIRANVREKVHIVIVSR